MGNRRQCGKATNSKTLPGERQAVARVIRVPAALVSSITLDVFRPQDCRQPLAIRWIPQRHPQLSQQAGIANPLVARGSFGGGRIGRRSRRIAVAVRPATSPVLDSTHGVRPDGRPKPDRCAAEQPVARRPARPRPHRRRELNSDIRRQPPQSAARHGCSAMFGTRPGPYSPAIRSTMARCPSGCALSKFSAARQARPPSRVGSQVDSSSTQPPSACPYTPVELT